MKSKKNIVKILHVRCMQDNENKKKNMQSIFFFRFQNLGAGRSGLFFAGRHIKFRIKGIEIFRVEIILDNA